MVERRKHKRRPSDTYLKVFDRESGKRIGDLANLSDNGAMFVTAERVKVLSVIKCSIELTHPILERSEIIFDAQCRWCRKNIQKGWWESGYAITVSGVDAELVSYLSLSFELGKWQSLGTTEVKIEVIENLRKATRFEVKELYPVYEAQNYQQIGKLADLSTSGASLITPEPIKRGKILNCRAKLPKMIFQRDYLFFDGECMWCRKNEEKGWYLSGYRFKNISEHDGVIILHLIIHYLKELPSEQRLRVVR